jgi:hypothetical protein
VANQNFGEFLRFFPSDLNPFKIQSKFKSHKFVEFIVQIVFGFGSLANGESCSSWANISFLNFPQVLEAGSMPVCIWVFESVLDNRLNSKMREDPPVSACGRPLAHARMTRVTTCHRPITVTALAVVLSGLAGIHPLSRVFTL